MSISTDFLDTSTLPVARMREFPLTAAQIDRWLADMDALLQAQQAFVLVYENLPAADTQGDPDGRKTVVLWLKAHREAFGRHCRGMVALCESDETAAMMQANQEQLEKAYRVPTRIARSAEEVDACVRQLMVAS